MTLAELKLQIDAVTPERREKMIVVVVAVSKIDANTTLKIRKDVTEFEFDSFGNFYLIAAGNIENNFEN